MIPDTKYVHELVERLRAAATLLESYAVLCEFHADSASSQVALLGLASYKTRTVNAEIEAVIAAVLAKQTHQYVAPSSGGSEP